MKSSDKILVVLLGPSNCGKDYVAGTQFPDFKVLKLSEAFKRLFAQDHSISYEDTNNKCMREVVLQQGPLCGLSIREAMVRCYNESLKPNTPSYGAKFAGITLLHALDTLTFNAGKFVVTDLRKPSEAHILKEFAEQQLGYEIESYRIASNKGKSLDSDRHLNEVANILGTKRTILNIY